MNSDAVIWKQKIHITRYLIAQFVVSGCLSSERPLVFRRTVLQILPSKCNKSKHTSSNISWFGSWNQVFGKMNTLCKLPYQKISQNPNFKKKSVFTRNVGLASSAMVTYCSRNHQNELLQELDYAVKRNKFCVLTVCKICP